ncbi:MAG: NADP(H)-dependent aldo-keto reductase [Alcanivoracaceae bacterium]|nr:NADP(H)-dependent aldo-keto reductase [Alcanivoracaceae bacterium]
MEYRTLGDTNIQVSALCLGTMTWGNQNSQDDGFAQMDLAVEHGINFFDTAEMYAVPASAETSGRTEEIIGNWFAQRGGRDKIVLASKAAGPGAWIKHIRGGPRLNREHLFKAVETSLQRLQTDYLDLYQMHWPDRNTNYFGKLNYQHSTEEQMTPIAETVAALDELVKQGKIRQYGLSNETPWGTMQYVLESERQSGARPVSIQNPYSLLNRSFEVGLAEIAHREHIGLLAYSPLAFGMLSGKYRNNQWPENARLTLFKYFSRYNNQYAVAATEKYCALAEQHGMTPTQLALQFVTTRPFVTSNIIGATTLEQLQENLSSTEVVITDEIANALENIHTEFPNPAP